MCVCEREREREREDEVFIVFMKVLQPVRPPLWSSGQIQRSRVRFPALPDFLSSSGSGTGSNQPSEFN